MKKANRVWRQHSDYITEELAAVLSEGSWLEIKSLLLQVHANLHARNEADGGEKLLRVRAFSRLQSLVKHGIVERCGTQYRGVASALAAFSQHVAAEHCRELLATVRSGPALAHPSPSLCLPSSSINRLYQ